MPDNKASTIRARGAIVLIVTIAASLAVIFAVVSFRKQEHDNTDAALLNFLLSIGIPAAIFIYTILKTNDRLVEIQLEPWQLKASFGILCFACAGMLIGLLALVFFGSETIEVFNEAQRQMDRVSRPLSIQDDFDRVSKFFVPVFTLALSLEVFAAQPNKTQAKNETVSNPGG